MMGIPDIVVFALMLFTAAVFVDWLQPLVPDDCDVFGAIADEARRISEEAR